MIEFKTLNIEDIIEVAKTSIDEVPRNSSVDDLERYGKLYKDCGSAMTGFLNGEPVIVAGFYKRHKHDGVIWAIISNKIAKYKITVFRSIRLMLDCYISTHKIKKMLAETRVGFKEAQRFMEHLGFVKQRRTFNSDYCFYKKVI